ncbi:MAG: PAS domain-containing protein [Planctomycetes bacterium]|nr:PAS domain-containing protein [Planctomycetota bacterium]
MKPLLSPSVVVPLLLLAAALAAWALSGPAAAAWLGLAGTGGWLLSGLIRGTEATALARSLQRVVDGDRHAAVHLRPSSLLTPAVRAAAALAAGFRETGDALAAERLRRRILEQALREGLVILDAQQRVLAANEIAGRLLGFSAEAAKGRLLQECTRCPELNELMQAAFARLERRQADIEPPGAPGLVAEAVVACVSDDTGRLAGGLLLLSDVTASRSLDRMRADFAANVSHELRTPITNIRGYVETLLQVGLEDPEMSRRFLDIVHRNASRLGALVEDLLSLSFVENPASRERIEMGDVEVTRLFDWVDAELGPAAEARGIRLTRGTASDLSVHASTLLAEQAVANLVSNAIRYAPEGSAVEMAARPDGDFVAITVRDEGPGIPEKHLPRLFERFYRVDTARTREGGGTGLGLAIVKHIAMVHGGSIAVHSTMGLGSVFTLRLPAQAVGQTPEAATADNAS